MQEKPEKYEQYQKIMQLTQNYAGLFSSIQVINNEIATFRELKVSVQDDKQYSYYYIKIYIALVGKNLLPLLDFPKPFQDPWVVLKGLAESGVAQALLDILEKKLMTEGEFKLFIKQFYIDRFALITLSDKNKFASAIAPVIYIATHLLGIKHSKAKYCQILNIDQEFGHRLMKKILRVPIYGHIKMNKNAQTADDKECLDLMLGYYRRLLGLAIPEDEIQFPEIEQDVNFALKFLPEFNKICPFTNLLLGDYYIVKKDYIQAATYYCLASEWDMYQQVKDKFNFLISLNKDPRLTSRIYCYLLFFYQTFLLEQTVRSENEKQLYQEFENVYAKINPTWLTVDEREKFGKKLAEYADKLCKEAKFEHACAWYEKASLVNILALSKLINLHKVSLDPYFNQGREESMYDYCCQFIANEAISLTEKIAKTNEVASWLLQRSSNFQKLNNKLYRNLLIFYFLLCNENSSVETLANDAQQCLKNIVKTIFSTNSSSWSDEDTILFATGLRSKKGFLLIEEEYKKNKESLSKAMPGIPSLGFFSQKPEPIGAFIYQHYLAKGNELAVMCVIREYENYCGYSTNEKYSYDLLGCVMMLVSFYFFSSNAKQKSAALQGLVAIANRQLNYRLFDEALLAKRDIAQKRAQVLVFLILDIAEYTPNRIYPDFQARIVRAISEDRAAYQDTFKSINQVLESSDLVSYKAKLMQAYENLMLQVATVEQNNNFPSSNTIENKIPDYVMSNCVTPCMNVLSPHNNSVAFFRSTVQQNIQPAGELVQKITLPNNNSQASPDAKHANDFRIPLIEKAFEQGNESQPLLLEKARAEHLLSLEVEIAKLKAENQRLQEENKLLRADPNNPNNKVSKDQDTRSIFAPSPRNFSSMHS